MWFRGKDLRILDHAPLHDAAAQGEVIPIFILDPYFFDPVRARNMPHRMQFLIDSLKSLEANLARRGSRLLVVAGRSVDVIPRLTQTLRADRVVAHRWVEPFGRERDRRIAESVGARFELYEGETLMPPGTLRTASGRPYSIFGQFARAFRHAAAIGAPIPPPSLRPLPTDVELTTIPIPTLEALGLKRNPAIQVGGEDAANDRLRSFMRTAAAVYVERRDRLDLPGTSRLSADIKFGTISVRHVWSEVEATDQGSAAAEAFLTQLIWREFAYSTLWDWPLVLQEPFQASFKDLPWRYDEALWGAWVQGKTGYPVVDASARQLLTEGFVHNRARMISASFLAKHLLIDYRRGEADYMRWLTDGDWANNNAGWQWVAGCGCGAQPYFRVMNPVLQGVKFDPEGSYVRRWLPELERLPTRYVHQPWAAPHEVLRSAHVRLGDNYPLPVVDHLFARRRFLAFAKANLRRA